MSSLTLTILLLPSGQRYKGNVMCSSTCTCMIPLITERQFSRFVKRETLQENDQHLNPLMAKEITEGACILFFSFLCTGCAVEQGFFPKIVRQLTGLHNSVLEDKRAQLILTSIQERQGHTCDGQLGGWTFCAIQRQLSLCSSLFIISFCKLKAFKQEHTVCPKQGFFPVLSPVLIVVFWKSIERKRKSNWLWNQNKYWVIDLVNHHTQVQIVIIRLMNTINVKALHRTGAQYHSLGRKLFWVLEDMSGPVMY